MTYAFEVRSTPSYYLLWAPGTELLTPISLPQTRILYNLLPVHILLHRVLTRSPRICHPRRLLPPLSRLSLCRNLCLVHLELKLHSPLHHPSTPPKRFSSHLNTGPRRHRFMVVDPRKFVVPTDRSVRVPWSPTVSARHTVEDHNETRNVRNRTPAERG